MKKIGDVYIQNKQSELFKKLGALWAFSKEQFEEQRQEGVVYNQISWLGGLIVPKQNAKQLIDQLSEIHKKGREINKKNYTKEELIRDELINKEVFILMDITPAQDALYGYGFTEKEILKVYNDMWKSGETEKLC
jgi:flagellar motor switch protein FliG